MNWDSLPVYIEYHTMIRTHLFRIRSSQISHDDDDDDDDDDGYSYHYC